MTELGTAPSPVDVPSPSTRGWLRPLIVAVTVVAVVAALVGLVWWRSVPPEMWPAPSYRGSEQVVVGHTMYVDAGLVVRDDTGDGPRSYSLRIDSISPTITENSAQATIALLVCTRNGGTLGVGSQEAGLDASCTSVLPFTGAQQIDLGFMTGQVLVAVTPRVPGTVHLDGFDVTYAQSGRSVTSHVGADITLTGAP